MRKYQKDEESITLSNLEESQEKVVERPDLTLDGYQPLLPNSRSYTKQDGDKDQSIYRIICGGQRREPDYYSIIVKNQAIFSKIKVVIHDSGDEPLRLLEKAIEIKREEGIHPEVPELADRLFLVSDVDVFYSQLVSIKAQCEQENIDLIVSNSCIEVWHYYHYFVDKPDDFVVPSEEGKISNEFKTYVGRKVRGGIKTTRDIFKISEAIENSKRNYAEDSNRIPLLFATNMFILGESLHDLIKEGLEKITEMNDKKRAHSARNKRSDR